MRADGLDSTAVELLHCDRPMRYRSSRTWWEGQPKNGTEITTTIRVCACGAELTTTLRQPS